MEAHDICDSLAHETEGVRLCVVLDLDTGITLLTSRRAVVDADEVRRVVRTACLVCQNKLLGRYAAALSPPRPADGLVREAHVSTTAAHIFMGCLPNLPNALLICETDKTMNIGFGWIAVHRALERFASVPPEALAVPLEPERDAAVEPQRGAAPATEPRTPPGPEPRPAREPERPAARGRDHVPADAEPAARAPAANAPGAQPPRRPDRRTPSAGSADAAPASPQVPASRPDPASAPAAAPEPEAPEAAAAPDAPPRQARLGARAGFRARPPRDRRKR